MAGADWGWRGGDGREEGWGREQHQAGERWHGAKAGEGCGWGYNTPELLKGRVRLSCGDTWGGGGVCVTVTSPVSQPCTAPRRGVCVGDGGGASKLDTLVSY